MLVCFAIMETPNPPQTLVPMSSNHQEIFRTLILGLQTLASTLAPSSSSAAIHPRVLDDLLSSSPLPPTEFLGNLVSNLNKLEEMFSVQESTTTKMSQKRKVAEEVDTPQVVSVVCDCCSWGGGDDNGLVAEPVTPPRVPHQQIRVLDHPDLQDGSNSTWTSILIAKIIEQESVSQNIDLLWNIGSPKSS